MKFERLKLFPNLTPKALPFGDLRENSFVIRDSRC